MTCKDCMHDKICFYQVNTPNITKCPNFKNKADIIDIPDDTIMYIQDKWLVINTESEQLGEAIKCLFRQFNQ